MSDFNDLYEVALSNTKEQFGKEKFENVVSIINNTNEERVINLSPSDVADVAKLAQPSNRFFGEEINRIKIASNGYDLSVLPKDVLKINKASELDSYQIKYGVVEAYIKACGFEIIRCVDDRRGDYGDDRGYMAFVLGRDNTYYSLIIAINYNIDCDRIAQDIKEDLKPFDSLDDVYKFYSDFADTAHKHAYGKNYRGSSGYKGDAQIKEYIRCMLSSYSDYPVQNYCNLKRIDLVLYEENFNIYERAINETMLEYLEYDEIGSAPVEELREDGESLAMVIVVDR